MCGGWITVYLGKAGDWRDYILPFHKHSVSQAVQIACFNSSIKWAEEQMTRCVSKTVLLFLSKACLLGERREDTQIKALRLGGSRGQSIYRVFSIASLNSHHKGKGFSRRQRTLVKTHLSLHWEIKASETNFCESLFVLTSPPSLLQLLSLHLRHWLCPRAFPWHAAAECLSSQKQPEQLRLPLKESRCAGWHTLYWTTEQQTFLQKKWQRQLEFNETLSHLFFKKLSWGEGGSTQNI